jgi:hypothetical protein
MFIESAESSNLFKHRTAVNTMVAGTAVVGQFCRIPFSKSHHCVTPANPGSASGAGAVQADIWDSLPQE